MNDTKLKIVRVTTWLAVVLIIASIIMALTLTGQGEVMAPGKHYNELGVILPSSFY